MISALFCVVVVGSAAGSHETPRRARAHPPWREARRGRGPAPRVRGGRRSACQSETPAPTRHWLRRSSRLYVAPLLVQSRATGRAGTTDHAAGMACHCAVRSRGFCCSPSHRWASRPPRRGRHAHRRGPVVIWLEPLSLSFWAGLAARYAGLRGRSLALSLLGGLVLSAIVLLLDVLLQPGQPVRKGEAPPARLRRPAGSDNHVSASVVCGGRRAVPGAGRLTVCLSPLTTRFSTSSGRCSSSWASSCGSGLRSRSSRTSSVAATWAGSRRPSGSSSSSSSRWWVCWST